MLIASPLVMHVAFSCTSWLEMLEIHIQGVPIKISHLESEGAI